MKIKAGVLLLNNKSVPVVGDVDIDIDMPPRLVRFDDLPIALPQELSVSIDVKITHVAPFLLDRPNGDPTTN